MATENVLKLKKRAVDLGAEKDWAVKAGRKELEDFITNAGKTKAPAAKKKTATKAAKKSGTATKATKKKTAAKAEKSETISTPKKTAKKASSKKAPAAQSTKKSGKAKRPSATKATKIDKNAGRVLIGGIDWSVESDQWQPRSNSPVMRLFKALKKFKGNVDKAYDQLAPDMWDFVGKTKRDGSKRTKAEGETMLRYRLNRTKFEFATRTGQHSKGANRVEYGTGKHATANKKAAQKAKREATKATKAPAKKSTTKKTGKKSKK